MIDLATRADVPAILALSNQAAADGIANLATQPESLDQWLTAFDATHERYPCLVARDGDRVAAFAKGSPHRARDAYAWSADVTIYVDPAFHRRGLARRLYHELFRLMEAQGYVTLIAGISLPNDPSVALHESFGFVRCATFHRVGYKGGWRSVGYWEKHLWTHDTAPGPIRDVRAVWTTIG